MKQQSRAVQARWAAEKASPEEARAFYESLDLDRLLSLHKVMRLNLELASAIINDRINRPTEQRCKTCGKTYDDMRKGKPDWFLNRPYYDKDDPRIIRVSHFCSANCVSLENNKTQGVRGVSDQGMTPDMNPKNHPRQVDVQSLHDKAV